MDSARANLAATFVNGFVNAGFGVDKLVTVQGEDEKVRRVLGVQGGSPARAWGSAPPPPPARCSPAGPSNPTL